MGRALIVSAGTNSNEYLARQMTALGYPRPAMAASGSEARRLLDQAGFDLVIINAPLPDEFGHELGLFAAEHTLAGVLLLAKSEAAGSLGEKVEEYGVLTLAKPFSVTQFHQAVRMTKACHQRLMILEAKNDALQKKLAQVRLVDRAKWYLIQNCGLAEEQVHRAIEKRAMDARTTRGQVAQEILDGRWVPEKQE